ncbi:MAG: hypothetical protein ABI599_11175 [Flavobacteriales bacterium]
MEHFPSRAFLFALVLPALLGGCKKEEEEPVAETTSGGDQISITDDPVVWMQTDAGPITLSLGGGIQEIFDSNISGGPAPDTSHASYLAGFGNGTDEVFSLQKGTLSFVGTTPTDGAFMDFFDPGWSPLYDPGVVLKYRDGSGHQFSTGCGQDFGSLEITHSAYQQIGQDHYTKVRAKFVAILHSCDSTANNVLVSEGVLVLRFKNQP